jgi:TonB family protein
MRLQRCLPAGPGDFFGPAAPVWRRLALALGASVALHTAVVLAVRPSPGGAPPPGYLFTARLAPAAEPQDLTRPLKTGMTGSADALVDQAPPAATPDAGAPTQSEPAAPAGWAPPPAPRYYLASELDRQPGPLQAIEPEVPADAGEREAIVQLRLDINDRGTVDEAEVIRADPDGLLEKSALSAFSGARFAPGMRNGVPVGSRIFVEVQYSPPQAGARPPRVVSGRGY